jgi:plasmid stabilization system protein ParE
MISAVTQRPRARLDLLEKFVHFGEQDGVELAERYIAAVDATCLRLVSIRTAELFTMQLSPG